MWPKRYIVLLIALWLILDYRLYQLLYRGAYPIVALIIVIVGLVLAHGRNLKDVRLRVPRSHFSIAVAAISRRSHTVAATTWRSI